MGVFFKTETVGTISASPLSSLLRSARPEANSAVFSADDDDRAAVWGAVTGVSVGRGTGTGGALVVNGGSVDVDEVAATGGRVSGADDDDDGVRGVAFAFFVSILDDS